MESKPADQKQPPKEDPKSKKEIDDKNALDKDQQKKKKRVPPKLKYEDMIPLKWSITFEPPQLALLYKKSKDEPKKQLFVIQLVSFDFGISPRFYITIQQQFYY